MKIVKISISLILCLFTSYIFISEIHAWSESDLPYHVLQIGGNMGDGEFNGPDDLDVDSQGNVYVSDALNHRVQVFDPSGNLILKFGESGSGDGQFSFSGGVGLDSLGNIYVTDTRNHRVQIFDSNGNFLRGFGSEGTGDGQFNMPRDVAVASNGNIYVADYFNHRVQVFDSTGTHLLSFGSKGSANGQFNSPYGIYIDSVGAVYVADAFNHRIQKFDSSGNFLLKFGSNGSGNGQFRYPYKLFVDGSGNIYVADGQNSRVQIFDSSGTFVSKFGSPGVGNGQFQATSGIAVSGGNIFVSDNGNDRVQIFNMSGEYLSQIGVTVTTDGKFYYPIGVDTNSRGEIIVSDRNNYRIQIFDSNGNFLRKFGSAGVGDGQFNNLYDVKVDSQDNIYVADQGNKRIQKFDSNGNFLSKFGSSGTGEGQFAGPAYTGPSFIAFDSQGNIFVSDTGGHRIQKFDSNGTFLFMFGWGVQDGSSALQTCTTGCQAGKSGSGDGQLSNPHGIDIDRDGNIYVANFSNNRIEKYDSTGAFVAKLGVSGTGDDQIRSPRDVSVDENGYLYLSLTGNYTSRLMKLSPTGEFIFQFGGMGLGKYQFSDSISGNKIDSQGNLLVVDLNNARVQKYQFDRQAPTGNISVRGVSTHTNSPELVLSLSASDRLSGIYQMRISEDRTFTDAQWVPYTTSMPFTLSGGDGLKNIYVQYVDRTTNFSEVYGSSIYLDTTKPSKVRITNLGLISGVGDKDHLSYYFYVNQLSVKGVAEPNSLITFKLGEKSISTTALPDGTYSLTLPSTLVSLGVNNLEYFQTDVAGNVGDSRTLSLTFGVENFPQWLLEKLNLTEKKEEVDDSKQEEKKTEKIDETDTGDKSKDSAPTDSTSESKIYTLVFLDTNGKPMDGAYVVIGGREYYTNSKGEIRVADLDGSKQYRAQITYNGVKYETDVLGTSGTTERVQIQVEEGDAVGRGGILSGIPLYIVIPILIFFFILILFFIFKRRKDSSEEEEQLGKY